MVHQVDTAAAHPVLGRQFTQRRQLGAARRLGHRAAPGKTAAGGRVDRAGWVAAEFDALGCAAA